MRRPETPACRRSHVPHLAGALAGTGGCDCAAACAPGPSTRPSASVTVYMRPALVPSFMGLATIVTESPGFNVDGFHPWRDSVFGLPHSKLQSVGLAVGTRHRDLDPGVRIRPLEVRDRAAQRHTLFGSEHCGGVVSGRCMRRRTNDEGRREADAQAMHHRVSRAHCSPCNPRRREPATVRAYE